MTTLDVSRVLGNWHHDAAVSFDYGSFNGNELHKNAANLHDPNPVEAEHVYQQLLANYPPNSINWVRTIPWIGPVEIPLDRVDWDDVNSWAASHQGKRVKEFRKRIRSADNDVHPVVGVQVPGDDRLKIVDGHHRALAYRKENRPVKAYVGFVPSDNENSPWFQTHDYQISNGQASANKFIKISGHSTGSAAVMYDILKPVPELSPDDVVKLPTVWEFVTKNITAGAVAGSGAVSGLVPYDLVGQQENDEEPEEEDNRDDDAPGNWEPVSFARKNAAGKIIIRLAHLIKVGKEGYIHGYICVRPPCGPQYSEAVFNTKNGKVLAGDGTQIGALRKNADGTYSMTHHGADGKKVKLGGTFANRADAAKSAVLYHNVSVLNDRAKEPDASDEAADHLEKAKTALAAGDHVTAGVELTKAEEAANLFFKPNKLLQTHIHDTGLALSDAPKPLNAPAVSAPAGKTKDQIASEEALQALKDKLAAKPVEPVAVDKNSPDYLWDKGLMTSEEYYQETGKLPSDVSPEDFKDTYGYIPGESSVNDKAYKDAIEQLTGQVPPLENWTAHEHLTNAYAAVNTGDYDKASTKLAAAAVALNAQGEHDVASQAMTIGTSLEAGKVKPDAYMAQWEKDLLGEPDEAAGEAIKPASAPSVSPIDAALAQSALPQKIAAIHDLSSDEAVKDYLTSAAASLVSGDHNVAGELLTQAGNGTHDMALAHAMYQLSNEAFHSSDVAHPVKPKVKLKPDINTNAYMDAISQTQDHIASSDADDHLTLAYDALGAGNTTNAVEHLSDATSVLYASSNKDDIMNASKVQQIHDALLGKKVKPAAHLVDQSVANWEPDPSKSLADNLASLSQVTTDPVAAAHLNEASAHLVDGKEAVAAASLDKVKSDAVMTGDIDLLNHTISFENQLKNSPAIPAKSPAIDTNAYQNAIADINNNASNIQANGHLTDAYLALNTGNIDDVKEHLQGAIDAFNGDGDLANSNKVSLLQDALTAGKPVPDVSAVTGAGSPDFGNEINDIDGLTLFSGDPHADQVLGAIKTALQAGDGAKALDLLSDAKYEFDVDGYPGAEIADLHDSVYEKLNPPIGKLPAVVNPVNVPKLKKLKAADLSSVKNDISAAQNSFMPGSGSYNKLDVISAKLSDGDTQGALDSLHELSDSLDDYGSSDEAEAVKAIHAKISAAAGLGSASKVPKLKQADVEAIHLAIVKAQNDFAAHTSNDKLLESAKSKLVAGDSHGALSDLQSVIDNADTYDESTLSKLQIAHDKLSTAAGLTKAPKKPKNLKSADAKAVYDSITAAQNNPDLAFGLVGQTILNNAKAKVLANDTPGALSHLQEIIDATDDDKKIAAMQAIHNKLSVAAGLKKVPKKLKSADVESAQASIATAKASLPFLADEKDTLDAVSSQLTDGNTQGALDSLHGILDDLHDILDQYVTDGVNTNTTDKQINAIQAIHDKISVAAGLKKASEVKPETPYTVQLAHGLASQIADATKNAESLIPGSSGMVASLRDSDAVAAQLKAGKAADVIRSARKLDISLADASKYAYGDTKNKITAARAGLKKSLAALEKQHDKDLSFESFGDRAAKLRADLENTHIASYYKAQYKGMLSQAAKLHDEGNVSEAESRLRNLAKVMNGKYAGDDSKSFSPDVKKLADSIKVKPAAAEKLTAEEAPGQFTSARVGDIGSSIAEGYMATGNKVTGKSVDTSDAGKYKNNAAHLIADEMSSVSTQDMAKMAGGNNDNSRLPNSLVNSIAKEGISAVSVHHSADVFNEPGNYFSANANKSRPIVEDLLNRLQNKNTVPADVRQDLAKPETQELLAASGLPLSQRQVLAAIGSSKGIVTSSYGSVGYKPFSTYSNTPSEKLKVADEADVARKLLSAYLADLAPDKNEPFTAEDERHLRAELVSSAIEVWKQTSNDSHLGALGVQRAAADEFGLPSAKKWAAETGDLQTQVDKYYNDNQAALREFVRAQYNVTQRELKKAGITSVTLHRAMGFDANNEIPNWLKTNLDPSGSHFNPKLKPAGSTADVAESDWRPLSSWSHASGEAGKFYGYGSSGVQVAASVPANLIMSTPRTGNGCLKEREWVVMAAPGQVKIEKSKG